MKQSTVIEIEAALATGYKGRKPGMLKTKNPNKLLAKARELYADDATFSIHLNRECMDEVPHVKKPTWDHLSPAQKGGVASRLHSKAVQRMRATRQVQKAKNLYAGGPGSGCRGPNCGRKKGHKGPHGKGMRNLNNKEDLKYIDKMIDDEGKYEDEHNIVHGPKQKIEHSFPMGRNKALVGRWLKGIDMRDMSQAEQQMWRGKDPYEALKGIDMRDMTTAELNIWRSISRRKRK